MRTLILCSKIFQQDYNTFSSKFEDPGCYELTKKATLVTAELESTIKSVTVIYPALILSTKNDV